MFLLLDGARRIGALPEDIEQVKLLPVVPIGKDGSDFTRLYQ